jgi:hypothetical protein
MTSEPTRDLDLITTEELIDALGCSKATRAILRRHGLEPLGGRQKFYRRSAVMAALAPPGESFDVWLVVAGSGATVGRFLCARDARGFARRWNGGMAGEPERYQVRVVKRRAVLVTG